MAKFKGNAIGAWAFLIGVILAVIIGVLPTLQIQLGVSTTWLQYLLVILGLIVGFLNVANKDINTFLLAALALVIVSYMAAASLSIIPIIGSVFSALLMLFVPATVIVALKSVFSIAK